MSHPTPPTVVADMQSFLLWLIPTVETSPRSQRFVLGDRIENLALDIFELLLEASYLRNNRSVLTTANLKLEVELPQIMFASLMPDAPLAY